MSRRPPRMGQYDNRTIREELLENTTGQPCCFWCDEPLCLRENLTVDHVISRGSGGAHHVDNAVLACIRCQRERAFHESLVGQELVLQSLLERQRAGNKSPSLARLIEKRAACVESNRLEINRAREVLNEHIRLFSHRRGSPPRVDR